MLLLHNYQRKPSLTPIQKIQLTKICWLAGRLGARGGGRGRRGRRGLGFGLGPRLVCGRMGSTLVGHCMPVWFGHCMRARPAHSMEPARLMAITAGLNFERKTAAGLVPTRALTTCAGPQVTRTSADRPEVQSQGLGAHGDFTATDHRSSFHLPMPKTNPGPVDLSRLAHSQRLGSNTNN